jgi:hypothetical protein
MDFGKIFLLSTIGGAIGFSISYAIVQAAKNEKTRLDNEVETIVGSLSELPKEPEKEPEPPKTIIVDEKIYTEHSNVYGLYRGFFDESLMYFFQERVDGRYWYKLIFDDGKSLIPRAVLHRFSGAAIEYKDGIKQYAIFGNQLTKKNYDKFMREHI